MKHLWMLTACAILSACATPDAKPTPQPVETVRNEPPATAKPEPEPPLHFYYPAPMATSVAVMPPLPHDTPEFPRLTSEDQSTHSLGDVSEGWMTDSVPIVRPQPNLAILEVQRQRGLHYTTPELRDLVIAAAAHVQKSHPNSPVWLGNFSARGGGDIPYSVSHNSGRDADIGFFLVDAEDKPVQPKDLHPLDRKGRFEHEDGTAVYFDVARNWAFVEGLIRAGADKVQFIFVSNPLRRLLLQYARSQNVENRIINEAASRLIQPAGALPHNDHFHIRIYCSVDDLEAGCQEIGSAARTRAGEISTAREAAIRRIKTELASEDPFRRVAAVRRMAHQRAWDGLTEALTDPSPMVRAAAVRRAQEAGVPLDVVASRLVAESDSRAFLEVVVTLGEWGDEEAWSALADALDRPVGLETAATQFSDARVFIAQTLGTSEQLSPVEPLIARLGDSEGLDDAIENALRLLTNVRAPEGSDRKEWWGAWWNANKANSRDVLLAKGFRDAGYAVEQTDAASVWGIVRAIRDERPWVAWNAQRVLQNMSSSDAPTLKWPIYDAWYYWRWWFQKKTKLSGVPDVPEDLDTELHPYLSPDERSAAN